MVSDISLRHIGQKSFLLTSDLAHSWQVTRWWHGHRRQSRGLSIHMAQSRSLTVAVAMQTKETNKQEALAQQFSTNGVSMDTINNGGECKREEYANWWGQRRYGGFIDCQVQWMALSYQFNANHWWRRSVYWIDFFTLQWACEGQLCREYNFTIILTCMGNYL